MGVSTQDSYIPSTIFCRYIAQFSKSSSFSLSNDSVQVLIPPRLNDSNTTASSPLPTLHTGTAGQIWAEWSLQSRYSLHLLALGCRQPSKTAAHRGISPPRPPELNSQSAPAVHRSLRRPKFVALPYLRGKGSGAAVKAVEFIVAHVGSEVGWHRRAPLELISSMLRDKSAPEKISPSRGGSWPGTRATAPGPRSHAHTRTDTHGTFRQPSQWPGESPIARSALSRLPSAQSFESPSRAARSLFSK